MVIRKTYAATPEHLAELADLAGWWGGLKPAADSAVLREAVHRAWETEARSRQTVTITSAIRARRNRKEQQR